MKKYPVHDALYSWMEGIGNNELKTDKELPENIRKMLRREADKLGNTLTIAGITVTVPLLAQLNSQHIMNVFDLTSETVSLGNFTVFIAGIFAAAAKFTIQAEGLEKNWKFD